MKTFHSDTLDEHMYYYKTKSNASVYIFPKPGYVEKQALVTVRYGAADEEDRFPMGIAHFLEHKLFEDDEKPLFERFTLLGGSVDAFTSQTQTAYYISCVDNFFENFRLLFKAVQTPYFTDDNVEKEKGIIAQEINMYDDNPGWRVYMNLNRALYGDNGALSKNIAGTLQSINDITKEMLYDCYKSNYTSDEMAVIVVGDVEPEAIVEAVDEFFLLPASASARTRSLPDAAPVVRNKISSSLQVSQPIFEIGFKERDFFTPLGLRTATGKVLLDIIVGDSSPLYERLITDGLIDGPCSMDYISGSFYGHSVLSAVSDDPMAVLSRVMSEIDNIKSNGIDPVRFERIRRKQLGSFIRGCNSIEMMCGAAAELFIKDMTLFDYVGAFEKLTLNDCAARLKEHFFDPAVSIINPL
ncbi:MAG: insulinase family protein [Clostridiales bacterium]|jgi:predicted Zn-dependent peptidase|nr:insulinase family protein [Clostridiales bacterium]